MATVLIAPDSFKGSLTAAEVALAVRDGWLATSPSDECLIVPMADGGEGTLAAIAAAVPGARRMPVETAATYGDPGSAHWLLLPDGTGVAELAVTNGLADLAEPMPMDADTFGLGQVIADALRHGVSRLLVGLGGSASSDAGTGALRALGACFLDGKGRPVRPGARGLLDITIVDLVPLPELPPLGAALLTDVRNPLLGRTGAAAIYAPQKGATPAEVDMIERGLTRLAGLVPDVDPSAAGAGAAGGTAFGLMRWGASVTSGAELISHIAELPAQVAASDVIVVGEGRYDDQSRQGKVVGHLTTLAAACHKPVILIAGQVSGPTNEFAEAFDLTALAGSVEAAINSPRTWLRKASELAACRLSQA